MRLTFLLLVSLVQAKADYYYKGCSNILFKQPGYSDIKALASAAKYKELCSDRDFCRSLVNCISTATSLADESENLNPEKVMKVSWEYFGYMCDYYEEKLAFKYNDLKQLEEPIQESSGHLYAVDASTLTMANVPQAGIDLYRDRTYPDSMSWGLIWYMLGVFGFQIIVNCLTWLMPKVVQKLGNVEVIKQVRVYFSIPPMFDARLARWFSFYGQRLHNLYIFGLFCLNVAFVSCVYGGQTSPYVYADHVHMISSSLGFRSGYLATYQLPVVYLFAARNNLLIWLTGWNMDVFNCWHRWMARFVILQTIVHAGAYHVHYDYMDPGAVAAEWKVSYWYWGIISLLCWAIMAVHGQKQIRRLAYDFFVIAHVALSIVGLIGLHVHLWFTNQCKAAFWVCVGFWAADRAFRLVRILINGAMVTASVSSPTDEVVVIELPSRIKGYGGAYTFIHFLHPYLFWQSHPFTMVPSANGGYKLIFKPRSGITRSLYEKVRANGGQLQIKVFIDGPYGSMQNFKPYDQNVFLAGGIGITACYSHIRSLNDEKLRSGDVFLEWIVQDRSFLLYFKEELDKLVELGVHVTLRITGFPRGCDIETLSYPVRDQNEDKEKDITTTDSETSGSLKGNGTILKCILMKYLDNSPESIVFFTCGPDGMSREAREIITDHMMYTTSYIQYYDESFTM